MMAEKEVGENHRDKGLTCFGQALSASDSVLEAQIKRKSTATAVLFYYQIQGIRRYLTRDL